MTESDTPLDNGAGDGWNATEPGPMIGIKVWMYHCISPLKIVAEAPLKVVTFGAWRMLLRVSPCAAVRKK